MSGPAAISNIFSFFLQPKTSSNVCLVSREGMKFPIQEDVLKGSSDFFKAALENKTRESGKYPETLFSG
jgi:hypothetical protein